MSYKDFFQINPVKMYPMRRKKLDNQAHNDLDMSSIRTRTPLSQLRNCFIHKYLMSKHRKKESMLDCRRVSMII